MYMSVVAPLISMEFKGYIDLKLFFLFTEILAPYSYILLGLAHIAFLVLLKNFLVSDIILYFEAVFVVDTYLTIIMTEVNISLIKSTNNAKVFHLQCTLRSI